MINKESMMTDVHFELIKGPKVKIIMINGYQMTGVLEREENGWFVLNDNGVRKHVNIQLISTVEERDDYV